jgi:hypothetical protein
MIGPAGSSATLQPQGLCEALSCGAMALPQRSFRKVVGETQGVCVIGHHQRFEISTVYEFSVVAGLQNSSPPPSPADVTDAVISHRVRSRGPTYTKNYGAGDLRQLQTVS